jgi:plasmid stability protein
VVTAIKREKIDHGMDPILPAALALGGVLFYGYLFSRWRLRSWQRMAMQCAKQGHLHGVKVYGWAWKWEIQGQAGPLKVKIASTRHNSQVVIVIPGPPDFSEVSIRRESKTLWKTREIEIGSEAFDDTFFITGPVKLVYALLDAETRDQLLRVNRAFTVPGSRLQIAGGELLAETVDDQIPLILPRLLNVGERFARPVDVERRLARNATHDPEAGVRLQNLLLLIRELPEDWRTLKVLRTARSDKSPEIRLRAGKALGPEGYPTLLQLAESLKNDDVSAEAVSVLGRELSFERTKTILFSALRHHHPQTVRACLETLGRGGDASAVGVLVEVMEHEQEESAAFAAQALGTVGSPAAEGPLILALQRDQANLRVAAANALGHVGSQAAVLPLKEAAERFPRDPELNLATRQAIAEIQSRLQGATPGQLSLAGAEVGQLSLAQGEAGQLSLATDQVGQLSISGTEETTEEA